MARESRMASQRPRLNQHLYKRVGRRDRFTIQSGDTLTGIRSNYMNTNYGISDRYNSTAGQKYFDYQNEIGSIRGELNAWKFLGFVKITDTLLDFGCGGGWLLKQLPAAHKYGVEPNSAARECCARIGIQSYPSVAELPPAIRFNLIISHHALEHVPYPIQALKELKGKLETNGLLVLVLPIDDWRTQMDFTGADIDHHLHTWTPRLISNTFKEAGFKTERVQILTNAWPPQVFLLRRLPKHLFSALCAAWSIFRRRRQLLAVAIHDPGIIVAQRDTV